MTTKIYIELFEEGTPTWRPTQGVDLGRGLFLVLPTKDYDPEDETWEFSPGSIVICDPEVKRGENIIVAKRLAFGGQATESSLVEARRLLNVVELRSSSE